MHKGILLILLSIGLSLVLSCNQHVKEPSVAGSFYPADRQALESAVKEYLASASDEVVEGRLVSIVSPHAGYVFSGHVAAYGYKHLRDVDTVIIIGQSHYVRFNGAAIYTEGSFRTPLGDIKIDEKMAKQIENHAVGVDNFAQPFEKEHSIEVQLPFLQTALKRFKIVPILIGIPTNDMYAYLADKLTAIISENKGTIIVASTDLSHYHPQETATEMDKALIDAISTFEGEKVEGLLVSNKSEMCGSAAVLLTMEVSRRLGANRAVLFKYATSGEVSKELDKVVGYASIGMYEAPLTDDDRRDLLAIARRAIVERVKFGKPSDVVPENSKLNAYGAAFVTIKRAGALRGCIGHVRPVMPLFASVMRNAVAASTYDTRFPPMKPFELADMEIEVSVLSKIERLKDIDRIEIGRHGLLLKKDNNTGLLLPQVAVEQGWDRDTFLKQISLKAGLDENAWKKADLFTFQADVISERDLGSQFSFMPEGETGTK